jgi:hypothetical protein
LVKDASLGKAPAYHTRRKDRVFYLTTDTYNNAKNIKGMNSLPSKAKEAAFQILTIHNLEQQQSPQIWKKVPDWDNCGQHLVNSCEEYSTELWAKLGHTSHICPSSPLWEGNTSNSTHSS